MSEYERIIRETAKARLAQDSEIQTQLNQAQQARQSALTKKQNLLAAEVEPRLRAMSQDLSKSNLPNSVNLNANPPSMMKSITIGSNQVQSARKVGIMVVPRDDDEVSILVEGTQNRFKKEFTAKSGEIEKSLEEAFEIAMKMWHQLEGFR